MTSKFEKLIEHVINDEENEAQALFHEIVVETSREIYENLMDEEDSDEEETVEEGMMNDGDAADDLITDVETEEEGMSEDEEFDVEMDDAEDFGAEVGAEEGEEEDIEDRVVDLEDKLDELMAEFEAMMGGEEAGAEDEMDMDMDMDMGDEEMMPEMGMMENVDLKAAPKPVTTEPAGTNSRSTVAANSGAKGMAARPVRTTDGATAGRANPSVKDMGMTTSPAQGAAPKPVSTQAAGVNTKSPV
jgi:hypothetical protein